MQTHDEVSLHYAEKIMKLRDDDEALPGGETQFQAKVQTIIRQAISDAVQQDKLAAAQRIGEMTVKRGSPSRDNHERISDLEVLVAQCQSAIAALNVTVFGAEPVDVTIPTAQGGGTTLSGAATT